MKQKLKKMDSNLHLNNKFNVACIKMLTKTEGPFNRCCIWFQGCNINCQGCCNEELQYLIPKHIISEDKLIEIVIEAKDKYSIEGITLSGGEPSIQKGLFHFNERIKNLDLGIIMFSGKYKKQLDCRLVNSVDLLIDGPFIQNSKDNERLLIGSKNKRLNFITSRYINYADYFENPVSIQEINVEEDYLFINGD